MHLPVGLEVAKVDIIDIFIVKILVGTCIH
jgi:hypothetical protein